MNELPKITSRDNQRLMHARKVRDGHTSGSMFIEGKRLTAEALRSGLDVSECFVSERFANSTENADFLLRLTMSARYTFEIPDRLFRDLAATDNSQGVVLIADRPNDSALAIERRIVDKETLPIVVFLFRINNPSNLGAVLRTAEASDAAGIVISRDSADVYSPKALRAAMGASFRIPIWTDAGFEQALTWAEKLGLRTTATGSGRSYTSANLRIPRLLVFGSEAHGLGESEMRSVNECVQIPMENDVESLNLAVAAGIILFEAKRQNQAG